jgi:repressor of nif and glnA expression
MVIKEAIELGKAGGQVILESTRIDSLAYQSSFHPEKYKGSIPTNTALFYTSGTCATIGGEV